ncbi:MAG: HPP family protein [Nitrospirales bacterium]
MSLHSIGAAGLRTIRHITHLHSLSFHTTHSGLAVTIELLGSSLPGAPVLNSKKQYVGFISEFDVLRALESERELSQLTAEDMMVRNHLSVSPSNTIREAVELMKINHILVLPVEEDGLVIECLTRKDLLRAWIGLGFNQPLLPQ